MATDPVAKVAAHYDALDAFYRRIWGEHVHHGFWRTGRETRDEALRALVHLVAERARITDGTHVCDVGSGYGAPARMLAAEHGAAVTACTVSPAQHRFAARKGGENPRCVLGDWLRNDLAPGSFDAVVAIESTEAMPDRARFFHEAARVLRPGGRVTATTWIAAADAGRIARGRLLDPIARESRLQPLATAREFSRLIEDSGLKPERSEDLSHTVRRTWPAVATRFLRTPGNLKFLAGPHAGNRVFGLTVARIMIAYGIGALRYVVFTAMKP